MSEESAATFAVERAAPVAADPATGVCEQAVVAASANTNAAPAAALVNPVLVSPAFVNPEACMVIPQS
ncbi:hypothetical protein ACQQCD_02360 [Pseudarthrobacter sp. J1763]|uniref:hypothetical protein n=1 Tax=Pseudarthrobacter sp. J1763 TaxID=3420445 RepID=UPI003D283413